MFKDNKGTLDALLYRSEPSWLQQFPASPFKTLAKNLFDCISRPSLTKPRDAITVICISDTHNRFPEVPEGDLLIHAGDLSEGGTRHEIQSTLNWISSLPHEHKVVIAGNHDLLLDPQKGFPDAERTLINWHDIIYLQDCSRSLRFQCGRVLNLYGSPWTRKHGNWAFEYSREVDNWTGAVPKGTDVLITHMPPKYICNDKGEVLSLHTGRKLDPAPSLNGYILLSIQDHGGKRIQQYSHRLIYECYYGPIPEGFEIDHIDGNRANNCILNLACMTRAEHRSKTYVDNPHIVYNSHKSKCKKVSANGESKEFASISAAALGVMRNIYYIRNAIKSGKTFRESSWSFAKDCDLEGESWKHVVDINNTVVFKVSNLGRLQYANNNNKTFGHKTAGGYRFWYLRRNYAVHHLICHVFHGAKPTSAHTADHINRDPFDNRPENLRWATKKEQARNRSTVRTVHGYVLNTGILLGNNNRCSICDRYTQTKHWTGFKRKAEKRWQN